MTERGKGEIARYIRKETVTERGKGEIARYIRKETERGRRERQRETLGKRR